MITEPIEVGSDFSGVGAFNQALNYLQIPYKEVFACDMDKFARQTFIHNYGEPPYFPTDVYLREIPTKPLFFYMTSPPCQGFSVAGKREGSNLFFNSHEFIVENRPRFFCFENVKGLLSHDKENKKDKLGRTFTTWLQYLGGKSINGVPTENPHEEAVPYHIYWKVLNSKKHGTPQNRERVFIIGIRDDEDNVFSWPQEQPLTKRLRDVLEPNIDEKYFLSEKMVSYLVLNSEKQKAAGNGFKFSTVEDNDAAKTIRTRPGQRMDDNFIKCIGNTNPSDLGMNGYLIRRLTPRECFRLMGFPDSFTWPVSDSQAYKQAGNSIDAKLLSKILAQLKPIKTHLLDGI